MVHITHLGRMGGCYISMPSGLPGESSSDINLQISFVKLPGSNSIILLEAGSMHWWSNTDFKACFTQAVDNTSWYFHMWWILVFHANLLGVHCNLYILYNLIHHQLESSWIWFVSHLLNNPLVILRNVCLFTFHTVAIQALLSSHSFTNHPVKLSSLMVVLLCSYIYIHTH